MGLVLGVLYFLLIAQVTRGEGFNWRQTISAWPRASLQVILLALFWLAVLLAITIPASCALTLSAIGGLSGITIGTVLYFGLLLWVMFPLVFSPLGVILDQRKVWQSVIESIRLTRFTLPTTGVLFIVMIVISEGMDFLWNVPPETSWITLLAIAGHAFIAASLLATYFIYYREASLLDAARCPAGKAFFHYLAFCAAGCILPGPPGASWRVNGKREYLFL